MGLRLIHQTPHPDDDVPLLKRSQRRRRWIAGIVVCAVLGGMVFTQTGSFGRWILLPLLFGSDGVSGAARSLRFQGVGRIVGEGVRVTLEDGDADFRCQRIELEFRLIDWLSGRGGFRSVTVEQGDVTIRLPDGEEPTERHWWRRLVRRGKSTRGSLAGLHLGAMNWEQSRVTFVWPNRPGQSVSIRDINLQSTAFAVDLETGLTLGALIELERNGEKEIVTRVSGSCAFNLLETGLPNRGDGAFDFTVVEVGERYGELRGAVGRLGADIRPKAVHSAGLWVSRQGESLGSLVIEGPLDAERREGHLTVTGKPFQAPLISLFTPFSDAWVVDGELALSGEFDTAFGGSALGLRCEVRGSGLTLANGDERTSPTELEGGLALQWQRRDEMFIVQSLSLNATSEERPWLSVELDSPVILRQGNDRPGVQESEILLKVDALDLAGWPSLFFRELPPGRLHMVTQAMLLEDGREITVDVEGRVEALELVLPSGSSIQTELTTRFQTVIEGFNRVRVEEIHYAWRDEQAIRVEGSGGLSFTLDDPVPSFRIEMQGELPWFVELGDIDGLSVVGGRFDAMIRTQENQGERSVFVSASASDLRGAWSRWDLDDLQLGIQVEMRQNLGRLVLNLLDLDFRRGYRDAGSIALDGSYQFDDQSGSLRFKTLGINQNLIGAELASYVSANSLIDAEFWARGELLRDRTGSNRLTGAAGLRDIVGRSAREGRSSTLDCQLDFDLESTEAELLVHRSRLELAGSKRAPANAIEIVGRGANEAGSTIRFDLSGDRVDLSDYWAVLSDWRTNSDNPADNQAESKGTVDSKGRRDLLEFNHLAQSMGHSWNLQASLGEIYLSPLAITNLVLGASLSPEGVAMDSLKMGLNGGHVEGRFHWSDRPEGENLNLQLAVLDVPVAAVQRVVDPRGTPMAGRLTAKVDLVGQSLFAPADQTAMEGFIEGELTDTVVPKEQLGNALWLIPVMRSLGMPASRGLDLEKVRWQLSLRGEEAILEELMVGSDQLALATKGSWRWSPDLIVTPLNLPVELRLSRALAQRLDLIRKVNWETEERAVVPRLGTLQGTLSDLEIEWDQRALMGLVGNLSTGSDPQKTLAVDP